MLKEYSLSGCNLAVWFDRSPPRDVKIILGDFNAKVGQENAYHLPHYKNVFTYYCNTNIDIVNLKYIVCFLT